MQKFIVNEYITVFLEGDNKFSEFVIYINNKPFKCLGMHLILQLKKRPFTLRDIRTIDDVYDRLVINKDEHEFDIIYKSGRTTPEEEFWGCCSNLQVWAENFYNTDLLYHELAFPILKILVNEGDNIAKMVFEKEILKRFINGHILIKHFLFNEGYLNYVKIEDIVNHFESLEEDQKFSTFFSLKSFLHSNDEGQNKILEAIEEILFSV